MKSILTLLLFSCGLLSAQSKSAGINGEGIGSGNRTAFITALGGSTAGRSILQLANPSSISYLRVNADNSAALLSAAGLKSGLAIDLVNNTSDATKPVSTAQQAAIDSRLPADGSMAALRTAKAAGYQSKAFVPNRIWRLYLKLQRDQYSAGGLVYRNSFRGVTFGDSVSVALQDNITSYFGYGGRDINLQSFTVTGTGATTEGSWTTGALRLYDEWSRTPGGFIQYLDSTVANAAQATLTTSNPPLHSLYVQYLSGSGGTGYGSFKLQYDLNNSGSYVDCTAATVSSGGGSVASGVVNTNNSTTEAYSQAIFTLPKMGTCKLRFVATSGRVRICETIANAGGFGVGAATGQGYLAGGLNVDYSQGGKSLMEWANYTQPVITAALGFVDPHIITYKNANNYALSTYQTYWPAFATKIRTAAPKALFIVVGSHPRNVAPSNLDAADIAVDDYLRDWCASNEGAIFVDIRQNFPAYDAAYASDSTLADDLWSDGIHIFGGPDTGPAGGEAWVRALVWDQILPALQANAANRNAANHSAVLPMSPSEIRLYDGVDAGLDNRSGKLILGLAPGSTGALDFQSADMPYNTGNQQFERPSGMRVTSSLDTVSPWSLGFKSFGFDAFQFGHHANGPWQGLAIGIGESSSTNLSRAKDGVRIKVPWNVYGMKNGVIIEGRSDSATNDRILGIDVGATDAAAGAPLWTWFTTGAIEYEGVTNDAYETRFEFDEPTGDATITTPVNAHAGSGVKQRYIGVIPGYVITSDAIEDEDLASGDVFYDEATKKVKVKP